MIVMMMLVMKMMPHLPTAIIHSVPVCLHESRWGGDGLDGGVQQAATSHCHCVTDGRSVKYSRAQ